MVEMQENLLDPVSVGQLKTVAIFTSQLPSATIEPARTPTDH
jgi:hypothetical protein